MGPGKEESASLAFDKGTTDRSCTRKGRAMDYVERFFGISPDGGNGAFELSILVAFAAIPLVFIFRHRLLTPLQRLWSRAVRTRA
jgi:hypothetical protein